MRRWSISRVRRPGWDSISRAGGLIGTAYETAFEHFDRPYLLGLFGAMMGLPFAWRVDRADQRETAEPHTPPQGGAGAGDGPLPPPPSAPS